ncbi:DUF2723 domain-containing protein [bacterium]|nr:DUF2723 domain-containing protein [bacterium]
MENWYRRPQVLVAAGVFVLTLAVYGATLNPTTPFWDAGEYITTSHIVGVPHQPGTPLYVLVGRVFDVLFGQADITTASYSTARAVNFMSAFFSALAVMFIYLVIWELARRSDPDSGWLAHVGGVVGALFLAFSETYWNNAIEAEVYGLSAFMIAFLSWLAIRWYDAREHAASNQLLLLIVYLLGLGVGFHLGSLLVYPGIFVLMVVARRRQLPLIDVMVMSAGLAIFLASTSNPRDGALAGSWDSLVMFALVVYVIFVGIRAARRQNFALLGSVLFFAGLTVHYMMMVRAGANPEPYVNQTDPDTFGTLVEVIRREQYPPIKAFPRRADLLWQYQYYYDFLFKQFYFLGDGTNLLSRVSTVLGPIFLALVGLFQGLRRVRPLIFVPLVGYLINGEALTFYLNFTASEVRDRDYFYFAAFMFLAVFIGLGAAALLRYAAGGEGRTAEEAEAAGQDWRRGVKAVRPGPIAVACGVVLLVIAAMPAVPGHVKYFEHDNSENYIAYEYAWNILAGLDRDAIIFTNGDNDTFPIWYLQQVEKFRTDVTVVNLSLINLPWYIKQLKNDHEMPLAMARSDAEIDALRHKLFEDPQTGERQFIMVKDYAVHDIITTNYQKVGKPVFFAVTIPRENMARYYPNLQMEGMAYRLMETRAPNNMPVTDPQKVLENVLGVYRLGALLDGDTPARQQHFQELAGLAGDGRQQVLGVEGDRLTADDLRSLYDMLGRERTDVFRSKNARFLLGNYPAALARAGYEAYLQANAAAESDSATYKALLEKSLVAFETSLVIAPFNEQSLEFYPLLLVQAFRDQDAMDFLDSLAGNVPVEMEERTVRSALTGIMRGGVPDLALTWIERARQRDPQRHFYYQLDFALQSGLGRYDQAKAVMDAWTAVSGSQDPEMAAGLEALRRGALDREQQRIEDAVRGGLGEENGKVGNDQ